MTGSELNKNTSIESLKLSDYDAFGFDVDHTIAQFNIPEIFNQLHYSLSNFLIAKYGYDEALGKPLDADFVMRGIVLDVKKGNFLKLAEDGTVLRASHGTTFLTTEEIKLAYGNERHLSHFDEIIETVDNIGKKFRIFENHFDMPIMMTTARLIDLTDRAKEDSGDHDYTKVWPQILEAAQDTFDPQNFALEKGYLFPQMKQDLQKYLYKCSEDVKSWLKKLKASGKVVFIATSSYNDFASMVLNYVIGPDWKDYFDIVFTFAKKPGFFKLKRDFLRVEDTMEKEAVSVVETGQLYSQGNSDTFVKYLRKHTGKENPQVLFFGDSLRSDVFPSKVFAKWDTVLVLEELVAEQHLFKAEAISEPDGKRIKLEEPSDETKLCLTSHSWGSFFTDDSISNKPKDANSDVYLMNTLWGFMVRKYADIVIPQLEYIADLSLDHEFKVFDHTVPQKWGFYPGLPTALQISK